MRRVKIVGGMKEFDGCTGTIVGFEMDGRTKLHRVRLDVPVLIDGIGLVEDDLWAGEYLKELKC